ncbi:MULTISPECIES: hypothetical protein [Photorhabdus]|uniref:Uncharacterized protein n=2 Tax=Photorhabdus TaxID=29487 RepID=A0ABX0B6D8_9GAMM|nr:MULTISPECIES: hypothetical protein [Photorhabdus]MCC8373107.1 hypothetical protein [Photorhabdus bodei]MCC8463065.1 hypothetical protein [Photorhabdus bodei]MCT8351554.1 hypothetical protein [Photorhabdus kayaii]MDB6367364.1 hypothetical protein [Photorhabdus bodei]MDB6372740.1 hypothetical protein [Photorhabdus bodei]
MLPVIQGKYEGYCSNIPLWVFSENTQISRCIATARERISGSIDNDVTGVSAANKEAT